MSALAPPIRPMLARLARELPPGLVYEPKWDGFRCLAFARGGEIDLRSRHGRPLARYFPELVAALRALPEQRFVLDGEIVGPNFAAVLGRLHPAASRVERLSREQPASFVAFDLLAAGGDDLLATPFAVRRARRALLEALRPYTAPLEGHPWEEGFLLGGSPMGRMKGAAARWVPEMGLDWVPVRPELVCEVAYDHLDVDRFRHPARFRRFRPDRDARSCTFTQFGVAGP